MVYNTCAESLMSAQPQQQDQPWNLQPNVRRCSSSSSLSSDSDSDGCSSSFEECGSCKCVEPLSIAGPQSGIPASICCDADERGADNGGYFKSAMCYDADDAAIPTMSAADVMNAAMGGSRSNSSSNSNSKNSSRSWLSVSTLVRAGGLILVGLVLASAAYSRHSLDSRAGLAELSEQNSLSQDLLIVAERDALAMQRDHTTLQATNGQLLSELLQNASQ